MIPYYSANQADLDGQLVAARAMPEITRKQSSSINRMFVQMKYPHKKHCKDQHLSGIPLMENLQQH
jgi:hypothetical protein